MTRLLLPIDTTRSPATLHAATRHFPETNCYIDLWIELLSALELEPRAMLSFCARLDFEADQLTFLKPGSVELEELYGIECEELNVYSNLAEHIVAQVASGRLVMAEADSFYLPDTRGLSYRQEHVKSTIGIVGIDVAGRWLRYYHNSTVAELCGDDFEGALMLNQALPPFAELVKLGRVKRMPPRELATASLAGLMYHATTAPPIGPITRLAECLNERQPALIARGAQHYHLWAFANLRQAGAAAELLADHVEFLSEHLAVDLEQTVTCFRNCSAQVKSMLLKLARAVHRGKAAELGTLLAAAESWDAAFSTLRNMDPTGLQPASSGVFKVLSGA